MSPYLFAIYIDSVFEKVAATRVGCHVKWACASILMYADDVLLCACCAVWVMHNTANYKPKRPIHICPVFMASPIGPGP